MQIGRQPRDLAGQVVLVTGGARGIGRETAARLLAAGMSVVIGDKDAALVAATAADLGVLGLELDVTAEESWRAFLAAAAEVGPVDVLVNNAGIMPLGPALDEPAEVARAIIDVNVHGVILGTKAVVPGMVERGRGHVVNIASAVGRVPAAGGATYAASKHAVVGFTDSVRMELAPHGVDFTMVLPAIVRTELSVGVPATPGVRPQTPQAVAAVVEDVLRRPVAEAWVPRWSQPLAKVSAAMPRRVQAAMARAFGADRVLTDVDTAARADYERRARG